MIKNRFVVAEVLYGTCVILENRVNKRYWLLQNREELRDMTVPRRYVRADVRAIVISEFAATNIERMLPCIYFVWRAGL